MSVLDEVAAERARQVDLGYDGERDATQVRYLAEHAKKRINKPDPDTEEGYYSRKRLVQAAALLVAAVEAYDRIPEWERR